MAGVGFQPAGPISPALGGRGEVTPGVLGRVVIEVEGRGGAPDPAKRERVDLATQ